MTHPRRTRPVVAIDGPAGAGKSSVTRLVADRLGYTRVDTGALYRAVAWLARQRGVAWDDEARVDGIARLLAEPGATAMSSRGAQSQVTVLGTDVSDMIRTQEMAHGASVVSAYPSVRTALLDLQRELGKCGGVVLEGRDIGSVVFPDAEIKFYLTASVDVRAERRQRELLERGEAAELETIRREVVDRDKKDTVRPIAPLTKPDDALIVDSSAMSLSQVVTFMVERVQEAAQALAVPGSGPG